MVRAMEGRETVRRHARSADGVIGRPSARVSSDDADGPSNQHACDVRGCRVTDRRRCSSAECSLVSAGSCCGRYTVCPRHRPARGPRLTTSNLRCVSGRRSARARSPCACSTCRARCGGSPSCRLVTRRTPSVAAWAVAFRMGLDLVARGRLHPAATADGHDAWHVVRSTRPTTRLAALTDWFPAEAHAIRVPDARVLRVVDPASLIRGVRDAIADMLVRTPAAPLTVSSPAWAAWEPTDVSAADAWLDSLDGSDGAGRATQGSGSSSRPVAGGAAPRPAPQPRRPVARRRRRRPVGRARGRAGPPRRAGRDRPAAGAAPRAPRLAAARRGPCDEPRRRCSTSTTTRPRSLLGPAAEALAAAGFEVLWPAELVARRARAPGRGGRPRARERRRPPVSTSTRCSSSAGRPRRRRAAHRSGARRAGRGEAPAVRLRGRWVVADPALARAAAPPDAATVARARRSRPRWPGALTVDGETSRSSSRARSPTSPTGCADSASAARARPNPPGSTPTLRPYQRRGWPGWPRWPTSASAAAWPTTWGSARPSSSSPCTCTAHGRPRPPGRRWWSARRRCSATGSASSARFAPDVPVRRYHGGDRAPRRPRPTTRSCSPPTASSAATHEALAAVEWGLVVADEAQHVKNPLSRTARALRAIPAAARFALTGTPVENRLTELWAILDWTTPGLLGPLETFRRTSRSRSSATATRTATDALRPARPAVPAAAAQDRPRHRPRPARRRPRPTRSCPLTAEQADALRGGGPRDRWPQIDDGRGHRPPRPGAQAAHRAQADLQPPGAVPRPARAARRPLGQARRARRAARRHRRRGRLRAGLHPVRRRWAGCSSSTWPSRGIRAAVPARRRAAARRAGAWSTRFQAGECPVFLLSLKAGGTGLNLTRATHVVHYDRWWNPAVEDQATDRACRIGQDRPVQVHRLVSRGHGRGPHRRRCSPRSARWPTRWSARGEAWIAELADDDARRASSRSADAEAWTRPDGRAADVRRRPGGARRGSTRSSSRRAASTPTACPAAAPTPARTGSASSTVEPGEVDAPGPGQPAPRRTACGSASAAFTDDEWDAVARRDRGPGRPRRRPARRRADRRRRRRRARRRRRPAARRRASSARAAPAPTGPTRASTPPPSATWWPTCSTTIRSRCSMCAAATATPCSRPCALAVRVRVVDEVPRHRQSVEATRSRHGVAYPRSPSTAGDLWSLAALPPLAKAGRPALAAARSARRQRHQHPRADRPRDRRRPARLGADHGERRRRSRARRGARPRSFAASLLGTPEFGTLATRAGVTPRRLVEAGARMAARRRRRGRGHARGVVDSDDDALDDAHDTLRGHRCTAPRVSENRVTAGRIQLRLGRSGLWYRFDKRGAEWELVAPPHPDPRVLLAAHGDQ